MALIEHNDSPLKAEYNALTYPANGKSVVGKLTDDECAEPVKTSSANMVHTSPFQRLLATRVYTEIDQNVCVLLYADWDQQSGAKFACAQALAGCIIMNEDSGRSILVNTMEVYG
ncbi:hypothetical protein DM01DRAFT_323466 [Hesseltinella vesiculosa]|uniref:Uncharacterized protein n=1 Tax=Hesseltinella vesiculosa TaxID=101127 RepID=A0A1X2GYH2_9FUNG|nr:hypothetical protein DM01DRAFT_323466 [Hesseltinella vesiculosa]